MFEQLKKLTEGKKVLILGFGREGRSTFNVLKNLNCEITISDKNDIGSVGGAKVVTGADYQKAIYDNDVVFKSPGIVLEDKSDKVLSKITSQTDQMIKKYGKNVVGITGTKGKSTVTTLVYHILKNTVGDCLLMGNIGIPAFDMLPDINGNTVLVYELSCHQLEYLPYSPHIAVLLNIFEEHLDHYGTFEKYAQAKKNIYKNQSADDILVCNAENIPQKKYNDGNLISVTMEEGVSADVRICGYYVSDKYKNVNFEELQSELLGVHNIYNIAVAYNVCRLFGVSLADFEKHLKTYKPLPHRLEFAGEFDGIKYYDDSISTISETTIQALSSLKNVGTLIIGGMDRGICYEPLVEFLKTYKLDNIIFMYDTGRVIYNKIKEKYDDGFKCKNLVLTADLKEAVSKAKKLTVKGKICVMSPAAASYGFFKNFEERGDVFKNLIKN